MDNGDGGVGFGSGGFGSGGFGGGGEGGGRPPEAPSAEEGGRRVVSAETIGRGRGVERAEHAGDALAATDVALAELRERLTVLEGELETAREALASSERRREIERELFEARTIDVETAALLTEAAVAEMDEPDVAEAVAEIRARKPFLFRREGAGFGPEGAMGPVGFEAGAEGAMYEAAGRAREGGDRRELLRYLRLRRGAN